MKRHFIIFLSIIFFTFEVVSHESNCGISLGQQFSYNFMTDVTADSLESCTKINVDYKDFECKAGVKANSNIFNFALEAVYLYPVVDIASVGVIFKYNHLSSDNSIYENDFAAGAIAHFNIFEAWIISLYGCFLKTNTLIKTTDNISIPEWSYQVGLDVSYTINQLWKAYFSLKGNDFFDYPLFFAPFITLGTEYSIRKDLCVACDFYLKWPDVVTIADGPSKAGVNVTWNLKLK